jgi:hypothetical protein
MVVVSSYHNALARQRSSEKLCHAFTVDRSPSPAIRSSASLHSALSGHRSHWGPGADPAAVQQIRIDLSTAPAGLTGSVFDPEWFQVLVGNILAMDADPYNFTSNDKWNARNTGFNNEFRKGLANKQVVQ